MRQSIIGLLTDFGCGDSWVGQMKAVMLSIVPEARLVDITHQIPPFDVAGGAFQLMTAAAAFGDDSVLLAVVDPGVGSARRALAIRTRRRWLVGPDNGLLEPLAAWEGIEQAIELAPDRVARGMVSQTFHGRDIFAPAAAHLAAGTAMEKLGSSVGLIEPCPVPLSLPWPADDGHDGELVTRVIWIDRFGNLVLNLRAEHAGDVQASKLPPMIFEAGDHRIHGLRRTFSDVAEGEPVAYVGSSGWLEIAMRNEDAALRLGVKRGDTVRIQLGGHDP
ncbi:MAG: SAM-dependent chlorinase/fluorinase [Phycisphaeraceae bacterium]|nr:SAM-dependent chlorinase/fluorinase [Phycisphaeraceae bacterium]